VREQVVVQKVGNRSGISAGRRSGSSQRPARRERSQRESKTKRLQLIGYLPAIFKITAAIVIGVTLFVGYRAAASASFFEMRRVEVQGTSRASVDQIQAVVRKEVDKTGVWNADLEQLNGALVQIPWVRTAVVSRVLPDSIRVRIVERQPRAVVRTSSGRFYWVDEDAVLLGEMEPADQVPPFFLRGLSEEDSDVARIENAERVHKFLELERECEAAGIAERISEINVADLRDVRVQLAGDESQIEVRLGAQVSGKRLSDGLAVLDVHRNSPRGHLISYVDLSQRKGAAIGFVGGPNVVAAVSEDKAPATRSGNAVAGEKPVAADKPEKRDKRDNAKRTTTDKPEQKNSNQQPNQKDNRKRVVSR
jgi:cell division septal protein FtsQ